MDEVAVDAKRILLRYGAPIDVLDEVGEVERIELARFIAKTLLPERERRLRQELADRGYMEPPPVKTRKSRAKAALRPAAQGPKPSGAKGGTSAKSKATPKPAAPLKTAAKPKPKAKPKTSARPKAAAKPKAKTKTKTKPKPKPKTKTKTKTKATKTKTAAKPKTKAKVAAKGTKKSPGRAKATSKPRVRRGR